MKEKGQPYIFFRKCSCWFNFLFKHCRLVKLEVKSQCLFCFFLHIFRFFWGFWKKYFFIILHLLDIFGLGLKFSILHYPKLPIYKRLKWGRLAGPPRMLIPGKFSEIHVHAWLFSNPRWKVLIIVGISCRSDLRVQHNVFCNILAHSCFSSSVKCWATTMEIGFQVIILDSAALESYNLDLIFI